ncbi:hypothetical protein ODJ79_18670 [Actinoplanes sp. KI2]|uniref:hypothetical protein n=1 Tax=Actinoplanes sp. KI2 TaxID=2983315 RepID=UPI0021D5E319|nr:hypothetical protein [Actinoplanes sp. KI2]MCU7725758.1 hypothetical protein [Actinoplanes sp. KI2]
MVIDVVAVAAAAVPSVVAAVTAYGSSVLSKATESSADATVRLGGSVLRRVLRRRESAPAVQQAVDELVQAPADGERVTVLKTELRRALQADPQLAADVEAMLRQAGVSIVVSGQRAVGVHTNYGIVQTGDHGQAAQLPNPPDPR